MNATGFPWVAALREAGKTVKFFLYDGVNHAFNNDTSAERYNKAAADLAWKRTLAFFRSIWPSCRLRRAMEFRTERLAVAAGAGGRPWTRMHAILSHPQAMAYWSVAAARNIEQTRDWLSSMIAIDCDGRRGLHRRVRWPGSLARPGLWRFPEIGFILHPDFWGQRLCSGRLWFWLSDRAFDVHGLAKDRRRRGSTQRLAR